MSLHSRPALPARALSLGWAAVLALAFGLRLWRIQTGLPEFLDEALPFRHALGMWNEVTGAIDWNPHFFVYPSLSLYLFLFVQKAQLALGLMLGWFQSPADYVIAMQVDPTAMVLTARMLCVTMDLITVVLTWRIGERLRPGAGLVAAAIVACAPVLIGMTRTIYTDTLIATLAVAAIERTLAWQHKGGAWRLVSAAVLVGFAAGAKYPGAALLLPLAWAIVTREPRRSWWLVPASGAIAAAGFLITTPYILVERAVAARDLAVVRHLGAEGHFGNFDRVGFLFQARELVGQIGWPAVLLLVVSLVWVVTLLIAPRGPAQRVEESPARDPRPVLWLAFAVLAVPVALARVETARYLAPLIPFAALLATDAGLGLAERMPRGRRLALAAAAVLLIAPALFAAIPAATSESDVTRAQARSWMETHLTQDDVILQEMYAAPVLDRVRRFEIMRSESYAAARFALRATFDRRPWRASVTLPLIVMGHVTQPVRAANGQTIELPVVREAADLNQAVYDPRLLAGVDVVATSSIVRSRFEADPARYPMPVRFYALLDSTATVAARFVAHGADGGPTITIYQLTPRTTSAVQALGPLPPLWWTASISSDYPAAFAGAVGGVAPATSSPATGMDEDGEPLPWVMSLRPVFEDRFARFAQSLAIETGRHGAHDASRQLADAVITMCPEDVGACLTYTSAAKRLEKWVEARQALERTQSALTTQALETPSVLLLEYADVLAKLGRRTRAAALYESLAVSATDPQVAASAQEQQEQMNEEQ